MKEKRKWLAIVIIVLFVGAGVVPCISGNNTELNEKLINETKKHVKDQDDVEVTFYSLCLNEQTTKEIKMSYDEVEKLLSKISEYSIEIAYDPQSEESQELYEEIIRIADENADISSESIHTNFNTLLNSRDNKIIQSPIIRNRASAFFCNFATIGTGSQFPVIVFPRLIPIIQLPIPRAFLRWSATEGITSCGGLLSGRGYLAYGQQKGFALGFWGIGFSVFLPPIMQYGFIGYALYASTSAESIELWPLNNPPEVSPINPHNNEIDVPLSTSELRFEISDFDNDRMSYTVTTTPDIGSGSGRFKSSGVFSVPIDGLEDLTKYSWHIEVSDGKDTTVDDFSFITEANAPIVSIPLPKDGSRHTSVDLTHLSFTLTDYQGDLMDYTVETFPDIGSGGENGVEDGVYNIPVNDLEFDTEYKWCVSVTDGIHWMYKVFHFKTRIESGSWWDENWIYRKYLGVMDTSSDYQMVLQVWKENNYDDPDAGSIDCENNCKEDFSDIRFVTFDGVECSYWIEKTGIENGDHYATIWVKTPSSGDEQLYLYYGNPDANDQSNGDDTFIFFDDFEGDDYNHDVWLTEGSEHTWTVSDSIMNMQSTGDPGIGGACFRLKPDASITVPYGHIWYTKLSSKRDPNFWASMPYIGSYSSDSSPDDDNMYMWYRRLGESGGDDNMRTNYGFNGVLGGDHSDISSESWTDDAWHYFIMRRDPNAHYASFQVLKEDKTQWGNKVETTLKYYDDFSPFEFYYYQRPYTSGGNTKVDWVFVAKYTYITPSWESFGTEES